MNFEKLLLQLKALGGIRLGFLGGGITLTLALVVFLLTRINHPEMVLLYGDLELREGAQITEKLQSSGVSFEMKDGGKQIYVPSDEVLKLRMMMAEVGLPTGGSVGYEIFDRSDVLGSTNFIQNINLLRAVEGELSRTIRTIHGVSAVRVHVVLPQRTLFSKDHQKPTAAIVLKMRSGVARLTSAQVQAIQHLVASSIPSLNPDNISILDDRGVLLASGTEKEGSNGTIALEEARIMYETRIVRMIESLLEQSIGAGKVRAEVTVDLDMDRVTEQAEIFDPESQVARSIQNISDTNRSADGGGPPPTSVQTNIPNVNTPSTGGGGNQSEAHKSEETTNYEISKTVKTAVKEMGGLKRLSVAVLVDGKYAKDKNGKEQYSARDKMEIDQLTQLVKAVIGFQGQRGDVVSVMNLRFAKPPELLAEEEGFFGQMGLNPRDWVRVIEAGILGLVVLLIFLFVFKPYMGRLLGVKEGLAGGMGGLLGMEAGGGVGALATSPLMPGMMGNLEMAPPLRYQQQEPILSPQQEKTLMTERLNHLKTVEDLIKQEPENAAMILRIWMKR